MNASVAQQFIPVTSAWRMPVRLEGYDRTPLSDAERRALEVLISGKAPVNSRARTMAKTLLARLTQPLQDVYRLRRADASLRPRAMRVMLGQMHRRGKAFWQWSAAEWCEVVGQTAEAFEIANELPRWRNGLRPHLLDVAYLLCGFEQFGPIWTATAYYPMARVVFGADVLNAQIARLDAVLANDGYASGHGSIKQRHQALGFVLLLSRSPWLDDLCWAVLEHAAAIASAAPRAASSARSPRHWCGWASSPHVPLPTRRRIPSPWDRAMASRPSGTRGTEPGAPQDLGGWHLASRGITVGTSCTPGDGSPGGVLRSSRRSNGPKSSRWPCGRPSWTKPTTCSSVRQADGISSAEASMGTR
jgi:hypothetical protein